MSTNKEDTLRQFCDVTGADETRSRFFLESSNWQLEVALSSFYENGGNLDEAPSSQAARATAPAMSDSDMDSPPASPAVKKEPKRPNNPKFATLNTLQNESSDEEEEELSSSSIIARLGEFQQQIATNSTNSEQACINIIREQESTINCLKKEIQLLKMRNLELENRYDRDISKYDKDIAEYQKQISELKEAIANQGQAFYAGGSERSGQQILGPSKGRKDIVTEMFKSVRERGNVVFEDEPSSTSRGRGAFSGVGYRLGQTNDDHEQVKPGGGNDAETCGSRSVRLCLFREGFSVDGGALRPYSDPDNAAFLDSIRRGEIPSELSSGAELRVSLEDRRLDAAPAPPAAAFTGKGHMLGSPTPTVVSGPAAATAAVTAAVPAGGGQTADRAAGLQAAQEQVKLDDTQPATTVQFRLSDGSVITGRFNLSHTVQQLHEYIARAIPAYQHTPFTLCSTYPRKDLTDHQLTITAAGLANSTLLLRLN